MGEIVKPILACDYDSDVAAFPFMALPKIDGVRALNVDGKLIARSGKPFKNKLNSEFFSDKRFIGFDGEMVVDRITGEGICNETTSALTTINGTIETRWCVFDLILPGINDHEGYYMRWRQLLEKIENLHMKYPELINRIWPVPHISINSQYELDNIQICYLEQGFEGVVLRDFKGGYKHGRCTAKESNFLRVKQFMESEIVVTHIREGQSNCNEINKSPHGYTERSTHSELMTPNGMIGTICGHALKTEKIGDRIVIEEGQYIEIAPGKMTHEERKSFLLNPEKIIGKIVKFQFFPIGIKDKPRFPTFQEFRNKGI